jgi:ribosomal protein S18 acetylase RimI-like enzyme
MSSASNVTESQFRVRYAGLSENALLAELGARTFADTFAAENTPEDMKAYLANAFSPEKQAQELADPASTFLIMESRGAPVGYAQLKQGGAPQIADERAVEIVRIYADREWLGKGVGGQLMQACLREAEWRNCDVIWLGVWERNTRAIRFYQKWGFERVGTQFFRLGTDLQTDWVMVRKVIPVNR